MAMNDRTKVLLGVAVLALAGGAAWFLYFADDGAPPTAPQKVASTAPKPVPAAPKPAPQVQAMAEVKPAAEAPKPAAQAPKPAEPAGPLAPEAKPETPKPMAKKHLRRNEDARHCLDKGTNTEIIKCAEAYL